MVVALWNYAPPTGEGPTYTWPPKTPVAAKIFDLELKNVPAGANVQVFRVDDDHGNVLKTFDSMGRPAGSLTPEEIRRLRAAGAMAPAEPHRLKGGKLEVSVPAHGLAVLVVGK